MHLKTMEGLIGARTNMNMLAVPMNIYRQAERRGDLGAMERAGQYITDFAEKKDTYCKEADEGMELEKEQMKAQENEKKDDEGEEAASVEISKEGMEALMRSAEPADGKEEKL